MYETIEVNTDNQIVWWSESSYILILIMCKFTGMFTKLAINLTPNIFFFVNLVKKKCKKLQANEIEMQDIKMHYIYVL